MQKIVASLIFTLWASCAIAQTNPGFPVGPLNSNVLNQAFSRKMDYPPVLSGANATFLTGVPSNAVLFNSNGFLVGDAGLTYSPSSALSINKSITSSPTFGVPNEALRVLGTSRSGTATGGTARLVDIQDVNETVTLNTPNFTIDTLFVNHTFSTGIGNRTAINVALQNSGSTAGPISGSATSFYLGIQSAVTAAFNDGGTGGSPAGTFQGIGVLSVANTGATNLAGVQGLEVDIRLQSGSSTAIKQGILVLSGTGGAPFDTQHGSATDAAISIVSSTTNDVGFNFGLVFGQTGFGWPIPSTGTLIGTYTTANSMVAAKGIDFSAITFSTSSLSLPGFVVGPTGSLQITNSGTPPSGASLFVASNDGSFWGGTIQLHNTLGGATNPLKFIGVDSSGTLSILNSAFSTVLLSLTDAGVLKYPAATGTPAASLCIDAGNNIIKKTTAGSCI